MTNREFLDALQAEVKRLTDLVREYERQILVLQRENDRLAGKKEAESYVAPEKPRGRRRPYYA